MLRTVLSVVALLVCAGLVMAQDVPQQQKGEVKQYDPKKGELKVDIGGKEQTFKVAPDTKITDKDGKQLKKEEVPDQLQQGSQITITAPKPTDPKAQQTATQIKVDKIVVKKPEPKPKDNK